MTRASAEGTQGPVKQSDGWGRSASSGVLFISSQDEGRIMQPVLRFVNLLKHLVFYL